MPVKRGSISAFSACWMLVLAAVPALVAAQGGLGENEYTFQCNNPCAQQQITCPSNKRGECCTSLSGVNTCRCVPATGC